LKKPDEINFILGQSHFIKTVEDIHEAMVSSVPGIKFGVAFCEASGACLVRFSGTDEAMIELAKKKCLEAGCRPQFYPLFRRGILPHQRLERGKKPA